MTHLPQLITDLGLILAFAAITTLVFKKIKQPLVLGYILAGFLVGPHISILPTVMDEEGVKIWSEIGVIILLFSLGLEFSFKKLIKVGGSASITAIVEIVMMIGAGYLTGKLLGWSMMDSIFLGAILSMSSTTIIIRAFEEAGARTKKFANLVFGILIVEDLLAIVLLVLLSTLAVSQQFEGGELIMQLLKLGFFLVLWFLAGIFFVPTFLKRTRKLMNDETLLIVSVALCLLMVMLAVNVGFSAALGAFIMGSILAETTQAEHIEHVIKPVKNLFAAIFFVSVGMMFDPKVLVEYSFPVIIITLVTIFGKLIATTAGALLSGQSLKHSVQAGMSLAQIGEFSFIIASLGVSLNVTSMFLYPIAVAASAVTTLTTPFLIKKSEPFYLFIERKLPKKWRSAINSYSSASQQLSAVSDWKKLLHSYLINIIIHSVIIIAIIELSVNFLHPFISDMLKNGAYSTFITVILTLILIIPPVWALSFRRIAKESYSHLWLRGSNKWKRGPLIAIEMVRITIGAFHLGFLLDTFYSPFIAFVGAVIVIAITAFIFSQKLQAFYERIEKRFLGNLNEREKQNARPEITPWDAHLTDFVIPPESELVGKELQELAIREKYGINIALIERGKLTIVAPDRHERLYPGDKISVIGTDEQLNSIKNLFEPFTSLNGSPESHAPDITLMNVTITPNSPLYKQNIRNSGIREKAKALLVGIERNNERILNPDSGMIMENGDIVWIVGNKQKIREFLKI
ncbi:MAG TPA: cation:proton antiporter [Bacteroidia bacterium]|nr:cation:proton antiporter [Bacteroidia bacterium]